MKVKESNKNMKNCKICNKTLSNNKCNGHFMPCFLNKNPITNNIKPNKTEQEIYTFDKGILYKSNKIIVNKLVSSDSFWCKTCEEEKFSKIDNDFSKFFNDFNKSFPYEREELDSLWDSLINLIKVHNGKVPNGKVPLYRIDINYNLVDIFMISLLLRQHLAEKIELGEFYENGLNILESYNNKAEIVNQYFKSCIYIDMYTVVRLVNNDGAFIVPDSVGKNEKNNITSYILKCINGIDIECKMSRQDVNFNRHNNGIEITLSDDNEKYDKLCQKIFNNNIKSLAKK